jgi:hypothetical protein
MIGFNLPTSFIDNLEALLKRTKAKLKRVSALESEYNRIRQSLTIEFEAMANQSLHEFFFEAMANQSLHEFFAPTTANIHTGPKVNVCHVRFSKEDQALVICVPRKSTHTTIE